MDVSYALTSPPGRRPQSVGYDEFAVSLDETTISRELKKLGYVKLTARPCHHAQNEHAMEAFKKDPMGAGWRWLRQTGLPALS